MGVLAKIKSFTRLDLKTHSLFFRLLVCFLIIITLLVTFISFSVVFFRNGIKDEIIKYNTPNLRNTTESYEKQFELIENAAFTFSLKDKVQQLHADDFDYYTAYTLMNDIQQFLSNRFLYLDNMILLYRDSSFALERSRGSDSKTMFTRFFYSEHYSYEYWMEQFDRPEQFRIGPASEFAEMGWDGQKSNRKTLIPITIKNSQFPDFYLIAMVDAQKMYADFHRSFNESFYLISNGGTPYFSSSTMEITGLPTFTNDQGFVREGKYYYFYKKGKSGFMYVNKVLDDHIHSQMSWNFSFIFLLVLSIGISVTASFLFSHRLNEPVKKFIEDIQKMNIRFPRSSSIKEFNIIQERLRHIVETNRDIHQDLAQKNSMLRY